MTNNRKVRAGVVTLVVVMLASAALLTACKKAPTTSSSTGNSSTTTSATATSTAGTSTAQGQTATIPTATANTTSPGGKTGSSTNSTETGAFGPYPELPDPKIAARTVTTPIAAGQKLPPLKTAPDDTISGFKLGTVPDGSVYKITMRPYGIGPSILLGSRLAVRIDAAKPMAGAPALSSIVGANVLVLADTLNGGKVTTGGTYTAALVLRSDGSKLLPVMSSATLVK